VQSPLADPSSSPYPFPDIITHCGFSRPQPGKIGFNGEAEQDQLKLLYLDASR
jgi:hypothetical protein